MPMFHQWIVLYNSVCPSPWKHYLFHPTENEYISGNGKKKNPNNNSLRITLVDGYCCGQEGSLVAAELKKPLTEHTLWLNHCIVKRMLSDSR